MRAPWTIFERLRKGTSWMHKQRWEALCRAAEGVLLGRQLWLTGIGRGVRTTVAPKHAIKSIDRLLGNGVLYAERLGVYGAIANLVVARTNHPVVLVDSVETRPGLYAAVAAIAHEGRAIPVCAMMIGKGSRVNPRLCDRFLKQLAAVLPERCRPILVTDAGFENPWFKAVEKRGWEFVGRIRNNPKLVLRGERTSLAKLAGCAGRRPRNLGIALLPLHDPHPRRLVLSARPQSGHRQRLTSKGRPGQRDDDRRRRDKANEPWLLATTLTCSPQAVVRVYALRMQIEETFRDAKNHRWGWSLRHCRSRSNERIEIILLIAALAYIAQLCLGIAAEQMRLHYRHQANTERRRRVLSLFLLGSLILRHPSSHPITTQATTSAIDQLRRIAAASSPLRMA